MNLNTVYTLVSAAMILWVGCIWSGKGGLNMALKSAFIAMAFVGAVVAARTLRL